MKVSITYILVFVVLTSFGQEPKTSSNLLLQNSTLTNIDTSDILEINNARQTLIGYFIKTANEKTSSLHKIIAGKYDQILETVYDSYKRDTRYPKTITPNNLIASFISKSFGKKCLRKSSDTTLFSCSENWQYNFIVTIPYRERHSTGYYINSFSFIMHFEKNVSYQEREKKMVSDKVTTLVFSDPKLSEIR